MTDRTRGRRCLWCNQSVTGLSRTGEDVIPRWLGKRVRSHGPFQLLVDGTAVSHESPTPVMRIPICDTCNGWLNEWAEVYGKSIIIRLLDGIQQKLTRAQQMRAAIWLFKTELMHKLSFIFPTTQRTLRIPLSTCANTAYPHPL